MEEDQVVNAKAAKMKLSANHKGGERKVGKDPALSMTKIKQVDVPNTKMPPEQKGTGQAIPTADFADTYTKKMPHGNSTVLTAGSQNQNQKSPPMPKAKSDRPNQETKLTPVKNAIHGTEDDGDQRADFIPQAEFADTYTKKMPHGNKNLKAGNEAGGDGVTVKKPNSLGATTRPKGNTRKAQYLGTDRGTRTVSQITGPKGFSSDPSDAMKRNIKVQKQTGGAHNVVESGVAIQLKGKTKAVFEVVSRRVLRKMIESYKRVGYQVKVRRIEPSWKTDKPFAMLMRESVNAVYNFAPTYARAYRKAALVRFRNIVQGSYSRLYESRYEFNQVIHEAFRKIERAATARYIRGLEPFEVIARISERRNVFDIDILTEATDHQMALRQTVNKIAEAYGLDVNIQHVMVDGVKYRPTQMKPYNVRFTRVIKRFM